MENVPENTMPLIDSDNSDGTIADTKSGLMWQQDTALGTYSWEQALYYCENLTLAEYNDWRLPNISELHSLTDYSYYNPSIDTTFFPSTMSARYCSSTTRSNYTYEFWSVDFQYGIIRKASSKSNFIYLRCVRGAALVDSDADGLSEDQ